MGGDFSQKFEKRFCDLFWELYYKAMKRFLRVVTRREVIALSKNYRIQSANDFNSQNEWHHCVHHADVIGSKWGAIL